MRGLWLILAAVSLAAPAWAEYRAPRTGFGAPSLEGDWSTASLTEMERPDAFNTHLLRFLTRALP